MRRFELILDWKGCRFVASVMSYGKTIRPQDVGDRMKADGKLHERYDEM